MKRMMGIILALMMSTPAGDSAAVEAMQKVWIFEEGKLTEEASEELLEDAIVKMDDVTNYQVWKDLQKMKHAVKAEFAEKKRQEEEKAKVRLFGTCRITFYTHTGNNTASGVYPIAGHTAANNILPFGTRIRVDGQEYIIEDRGDSGMGETGIDIFCDTEAECVRRGLYYTEVYIIE